MRKFVCVSIINLTLLFPIVVFGQTVVDYQPSVSGGYFLMNFKSNVNSGSDKGFILFQDESAFSPGTGSEDVRLTFGVFNDFRSNSTHSDELWMQGGGRLVQNIGSWDSEYTSIIGTPSVGGTLGGYEWRINNSISMKLDHSGFLTLSKNSNTSKIIFSAQTNDPGEIRHVENNNSAELWIDPSDDFDIGQTSDFFIVGEPDTNTRRFWVRGDGHSYISKSLSLGSTSLPSGYILAVDGKAIMEEVQVQVSSSWPDYVFTNDYDLISLEDLKDFISKHNHLPKVPTQEEVKENGIAVGEMNALLLEKIEELTLYQIELLERLEEQSNRISELEKRILINDQPTH